MKDVEVPGRLKPGRAMNKSNQKSLGQRPGDFLQEFSLHGDLERGVSGAQKSEERLTK